MATTPARHKPLKAIKCLSLGFSFGHKEAEQLAWTPSLLTRTVRLRQKYVSQAALRNVECRLSQPPAVSPCLDWQ